MNPLDWIPPELDALDAACRRRRLAVRPAIGPSWTDGDGRRWVNLSSNDYLGLAGHPAIRDGAAEAARTWGGGATASRLVAGTLPIHAEVEGRLAAWTGYPEALLFGTGYLTALGVVPALVGPADRVLADRLAHASLLDAARLSGARLQRFRHNDADHLASLLARPHPGRTLVITESVFSMDGDLGDLPAICAAAARHGAMVLVDEAHALGLFGPSGAGRVAGLGLREQVHVLLGTLGKSLGAYGGFVAARPPLRDWLMQRARSFIYSTAPPPAAAGAALASLDWIEARPQAGAEALARARDFAARLRARGWNTLATESPIIPLVLGEDAAAVEAARHLEAERILVVPIRPPTVPEGTSRLRVSLSLGHTDDDLRRAEAALAR